MAGGNWVTQNKVLPGVYTNYIGRGNNPEVTGDRGIVALPVVWGWLPEQQLMTIWPEDAPQLIADFPQDSVLLGEAMKNANKCLVYRLNKGKKAAATIENLACTALCSGDYGNRFSVSVENAPGGVKFYVVTWFDLGEVERQLVTDISELCDNDWLHFSAAAEDTALSDNAGTKLSGGENGNVTAADHVKFLAAIEPEIVHAVACPSDDVDIQSLYVSFAKRMVGDQGKYLQAVVPQSKTADFEGVISVQNGVVLENGIQIDCVAATAYIAGATAACPLGKSLTNAPYIGAVDVDEKYNVHEQEEFARAGQMVFIPAPVGSNRVLVQKDINTLTTFTETRTYALSKNKIIRTLFSVATEIHNRGLIYYIGKVPNNQRGRDLFKAEILSYFRELEAMEAIREVVPEDIIVKPGKLVDAITVDYAVRIVDVIETIYNTIVVEG